MTERDPDVILLEQAIEVSGMSTSEFAREVLTRDERTVRRWLAGELSMPKEVRLFLRHRRGTSPAEIRAVLRELVERYDRKEDLGDLIDRARLLVGA